MTAPLVCKGAGDDSAHRKRVASRPGPWCATCRRERKKAAKKRAHGQHVERTYGITEADYWALYDLQDGRCFVCQIATGRARRLAVEHDHAQAVLDGHDPREGCPKCITGLACGHCNRDVLGMVGRSPATYDRIANALRNPPATRYFRRTR
jgi:hypothetical protein